MSFSQTQTQNTKPLTPAEQEEQRKREMQQTIVRRYHWEEIKGGKRPVRYERSDGAAEEEDLDAPLEQITTDAPLPKKLSEGWHNIYEENDTNKVLVHVDKNMGVTPNEHPNLKNKKKYENIWRAVVHAHTLGLGVNRFKCDYPNCYTDGQPDPTKYMKIKLPEVLALFKLVGKENASVRIVPDSALDLRLKNPKNKKEAALCKKIRAQAEQTQIDLAKNTDLNQRQAEFSQTFNVDGLKKETDVLKEKQDALKNASEVETAAKMKELDGARDAVAKRLDQIETDISVYGTSPDVSKKYEAAIISADKTLTEVNTLLDSEELKNKASQTPELETQRAKLKTEMEKLHTKAEEVSKKASLNSLPADERVKEKTKDLKEKATTLEDVSKKAQEGVVPLEEITTALQETEKAMRDINAETKKEENTEVEFKNYQAAMEETEKKIENLELPESEPKNDLNRTTEMTLENISDAALPYAKAEEKKLKEDITELKDLTPEEKMENINRHFADISQKSEGVENKIKNLDIELQKSEPDSTDVITQQLAKLEEEQVSLQKRADAFKKITNEMEVDNQLKQQLEKPTKQALEQLNKLSTKLDDFKNKMEERESTLKARPAG